MLILSKDVASLFSLTDVCKIHARCVGLPVVSLSREMGACGVA